MIQMIIKMHNVEEIITDQEINEVWGNANFGSTLTQRDIIKGALLKCAGGYYTGRTAKCILEELGLVTNDWELTTKGKQYLFAAYSNGISI